MTDWRAWAQVEGSGVGFIHDLPVVETPDGLKVDLDPLGEWFDGVILLAISSGRVGELPKTHRVDLRRA